MPLVLESGFIDSTNGVVLTSDEAMVLLRKEECQRVEKANKLAPKEGAKLQAEVQESLKCRRGQQLFEEWAMERRADMYGDIARMPRSLKVRRLLARELHSEQHNNMWNEDYCSDWKRGRMDALICVDQWGLG